MSLPREFIPPPADGVYVETVLAHSVREFPMHASWRKNLRPEQIDRLRRCWIVHVDGEDVAGGDNVLETIHRAFRILLQRRGPKRKIERVRL